MAAELVRSILFTVAELVRRHDPDFKRVLMIGCVRVGKPAKVVRIALALKLLRFA